MKKKIVDREVVPVDIAYDPIPEYKYKEEEDLTKFKSKKNRKRSVTGRMEGENTLVQK